MTVMRIAIIRGLMLATGPIGLIATAPASAQSANLTWVSGSGDDSRACTLAAPCKTFAGAIGKTAAGGEIRCLGQGEFGALTIDKALSINCSSVGTGTISSSGDGIVINAGPADVVVIDGLDINTSKSSGSGVNFTAGRSLVVRNTTIRNCNNGISFVPSADATLIVDNVAINDIGFRGISVFPSGSASVRATIVRSQISNGHFGVGAVGGTTTGSVFITVRSSSVTNNSSYGIYTSNVNNSNASGSAAFVTIAVDDSTISGNLQGLVALGKPSGMLVNNSTITNNPDGGVYTYGGGVIYSYGNNRVNGNNGRDGTFTGAVPQG